MTTRAALLSLSLCGWMSCFCSCSDDVTDTQTLSACPPAVKEHSFAIDGIWRLKSVATTGQCPAELQLQAPMQDGDFRFAQMQGALQIEPMGSSSPAISMSLVQGGYCHRRQFGHLSCELGGSAILSVSAIKDSTMSFEYQLTYERNDHPLCPADQLPLSCTVTYSYLAMRLTR
ncbi:MAG TPA: hypothetical protein DCQ06_14765 [Myxococcales bacterium]|nr:hypothetical protein [Myxococcales bacterium]HAN32854.1 hypothetical protein [Myxococcales bacterium]